MTVEEFKKILGKVCSREWADGSYYMNRSGREYFYYVEKDIEFVFGGRTVISFRRSETEYALDIGRLKIKIHEDPTMVDVLECIKLQKVMNELLK